MKCSKCNETLSPDHKFCTSCGALVEVEDSESAVKVHKPEGKSDSSCPECGSELNPGAKFCTDCGYKVPEEAILAVKPETGNTPRFCNKCGNELSEDNSCSKCDEGGLEKILSQVAEVTEDSSKSLPLKKILLSLGVFLLVGLVGFNVFAKTGRRYVPYVLNKTARNMETEIEKSIKTNKVLSDSLKIIESPNKASINYLGANIVLNNNPKKKIFKATAGHSLISRNLDLYLSDKSITLGSNPMYISSGVKNIDKELASSFLNSEFPDAVEELTPYLKDLDLSYSNLINKKNITLGSKGKKIISKYSKVFYKLIQKSDYKKTSGKIKIGNKDRNSKLLTLTIKPQMIVDWLNEDLIPTLKKDKDLRDILDDYNNYLHVNPNFDGDLKDLLDELIEELEYIADDDDARDAEEALKIELNVYKDIITAVKYGLVPNKNSDLDDFIHFGTIGEDYRLNHVFISGGNSEYEDRFSIIGNHINNSNINTVLVSEDLYNGVVDFSEDVGSLVWDTKGEHNNFSFTADSLTSLNGTFASSGDKININYSVESLYDMFDININLEKSNDPIEVPTNVYKLSDLNEDTLERFMDSVGDILYELL